MSTAPKLAAAVEPEPLHLIANRNSRNTRYGGPRNYESESQFLACFLEGLSNDTKTIVRLVDGLRETRMVEDSISSSSNVGPLTECAGSPARLLYESCCLPSEVSPDDDHWSPEIAIEESITRQAKLMTAAIQAVLRVLRKREQPIDA